MTWPDEQDANTVPPLLAKLPATVAEAGGDVRAEGCGVAWVGGADGLCWASDRCTSSWVSAAHVG